MASAFPAPNGVLAAEAAIDAHRQRRARRALFWIACLIPLFAVVDGLSLGRFPTATLTARLLWSLVVVATAWPLPVQTRAAFRARIRAVVITSAAAVTVIVQLSGGTDTILFSLLPCVPLAIVVLTQDDGTAAWAGTLVVTLAMFGMLVAEGAPAHLIGAWCLFALGMGLLAILGARLYRNREALVVALERERAEALERLADEERRRADAERARAEAQRLVLLGELSAGVAHEINNPLAFAKANLTYAVAESAGSTDVQDALREALEGLSRIEQIVRDMKSLAHPGKELHEEVSPSDVVSEALRLASVRLKTVSRVQNEVSSCLPAIACSRGLLLQALVNLLVNAADALETSRGPTPSQVTLSGAVENEQVVLTIDDNGPGLPEAVLRQLFSPFFTTKPAGKGTGLGLAISRQAVERMGGTLTAQHRPEGGARFQLRMPLAPALQMPVAKTRVGPPASLPERQQVASPIA